MALAIGEDFESLDGAWNVDGLGWKYEANDKSLIPDDACVLHWTGEHKHWLHDGWHKDEAQIHGGMNNSPDDASNSKFTTSHVNGLRIITHSPIHSQFKG